VIHNLVPEFLEVVAAADRGAAYHEYLRRHDHVLRHYWHNYVLDLDTPPAAEIIEHALAAGRDDLAALLASCDLQQAAADGFDRASNALELDVPVDVYLTVGVGAANAGELVVSGRGSIVICVEHFTGIANPETWSLGLPPQQLGLWIAHELAHLVRYLSPASRADMRRYLLEAGGTYDCWDLASRASLRELLVNEGIATHAARAAQPGHSEEAYLGYTRRQFKRLREAEAFLVRAARRDLEAAALGLRLRWLTGGMTPTARVVQGRVLPERAGYYLGARMTETLVREVGAAAAARSHAAEFAAADERAASGRAVGA
jgi:hypothetical protein